MKEFYLKFNLFENEIESLKKPLWVSRTGQSEYEGDDGFLHDSDSIKIIEKQLDEMKNDRNKSKNLILDVLNNSENYPQNVKDFYLEWLSVCINDKNEFTYKGKNFDYHQIYEDMLVEYLNKNNFIYKEHNQKIINDIEKNNNFPAFAKMIIKEKGIKSLQLSNGKYGEVIEKYIENNLSTCLEIKNKNNNNEKLENENNKIGKYFIVDLEQNKIIDISMNSEKGEYKIDFEKFISVLAEAGDFNLGNKYSNNLLIVKEIQGALDDIKFTNNEITVLNSIYNIGKIQCINESGNYDENSSAIKDTILINTKLEKTSNGEYDYNDLLKKECYSYNYNKELNVNKHIRRLKTNIVLIPKYGNGDIEVNTKNEVKNNQVLK